MIDLLKSVDAGVREDLTYGRDNADHGFDDWQLPENVGSVGDCEDFMLLAAHRLLEADADPQTMYFVLCHTAGRKGFNHAFLAVETMDGLHTCADTFDSKPRPIYSTYRRDELRQWARVSEPMRWRLWADD